jgi:hypothetical protein
MGAFKLGIVKFSIRIRGRYYRIWAGLRAGFATRKSFRTAPIQISVKTELNKGRNCTHFTRLPLPRVGIGGGLLMESLLPSSVCSVIRISRERSDNAKQKDSTLTPSLIHVGNNTPSLDKVSTKDGCDFVLQLYGFLIGLGLRLALVLKSIRAHLLAERWSMRSKQRLGVTKSETNQRGLHCHLFAKIWI